jgi:hypothetical protein
VGGQRPELRDMAEIAAGIAPTLNELARNWFGKDELSLCPFCRKRAVPRQEDDVSVCLECNAVWQIEDGEPTRIG